MKKLKVSFFLLQFETVITSLVITMPVINLLFNDIGMTQLQVGISQAVFMAVALLFDVPTGWLADRYSRRIVNMSGDLLAGIGFVLYASANSFETVLVSEIIIAIGMAATNGADVGLLKSYSQKLGLNYTNINARLSALKPIAMVVGMLFAGWLGTGSIRWPFLVSAGLFFVGFVVSVFIVEVGERRISDNHPIRDMINIGKFTFSGHEKLRWRVLTSVFTSNLTHTAAFILAPIFLAAGYSPEVLGMVWAVVWVANSVGALLARKYHKSLSVIHQVAIPAIAVFVSYMILGLSINEITVWTFIIFNLVFGWYSAIIGPLIQQSSPNDIQSTVISFSSVVRRLLYIPLVIIINGLASIELKYAMLGSFVIYGVFFYLIIINLARTERGGTIKA